jgi:hypothetical protein
VVVEGAAGGNAAQTCTRAGCAPPAPQPPVADVQGGGRVRVGARTAFERGGWEPVISGATAPRGGGGASCGRGVGWCVARDRPCGIGGCSRPSACAPGGAVSLRA